MKLKLNKQTKCAHDALGISHEDYDNMVRGFVKEIFGWLVMPKSKDNRPFGQVFDDCMYSISPKTENDYFIAGMAFATAEDEARTAFESLSLGSHATSFEELFKEAMESIDQPPELKPRSKKNKQTTH